MNRLLLFSLLLALGLTGCATRPSRHPAPSSSRNGVLPVVAVTNFENRSGFTGQWNLGSGMADLLVAELMDSGKFTVLERQQLGGVIGEIGLQEQPLFRREGRVDSGRLKNARYQIRGTITDFSQVSGGGFWVRLRRFFFRSSGATARVSIVMTVVEVESGQILASVRSTATASARSAYGAASYNGVDFGGDTFSKTPLGTATTEAIRSGVRKLTRGIPRDEWSLMIADHVGAGRVILNGGRDHGLRIGDLYRAVGPARVITDPATGDVLTRLPGPELGQLRVVEVHPNYSIAETQAGGPFPRAARLEVVPPPL